MSELETKCDESAPRSMDMVDQDVSAEENALEEGGGENLSGRRRMAGVFGISSASF